MRRALRGCRHALTRAHLEFLGPDPRPTLEPGTFELLR
jgi:hypothetical protein